MRPPHTNCKSITISRTADSWFIAFCDEQECQPTIKECVKVESKV